MENKVTLKDNVLNVIEEVRTQTIQYRDIDVYREIDGYTNQIGQKQKEIDQLNQAILICKSKLKTVGLPEVKPQPPEEAKLL